MVKLHHAESGAAEIDTIVPAARPGSGVLCSSQLALVEVQSIVAELVRVARLPEEDSRLARERFLRDVRSRLLRVIKVRTPALASR
jgi:hypothetical protein